VTDGRPLQIFFHKPAGADEDAPIAVVMHGNARNAASYRDAWMATADAKGFVVVAPHCDRTLFPNSASYNQGAVLDASEVWRPRQAWSFNVPELAFDAAAARFGSRRPRYLLFGHSAGAQFVHRFMLFMPEARVERAVAANAGFYTMPSRAERYPYGLGETPITEVEIAGYFAKPLVILLGDQDTDPDHPQLSRTEEAMRQGPHRFARGHMFFETARREAARLGTRFAWRLEIAPGVAHSNRAIAPFAGDFLVGRGP
jgi:poly(3-hydroxybutyrate) depolymerase